MACSLSADRDVICRTKNISSLTIREVFNLERDKISTARWLVPVFQRRYCWGKEQVKRLVSDSVKLCFQSSTHSLGRIVVHCQSSGNILLVDGQQRLTTTSIFLSAIRDFIIKVLSLHSSQCSSSSQSLKELVELCHGTIYSRTHQHTILEPSFYDRTSYSMCIQHEMRDEETFQTSLERATTHTTTPDNSTVVDHILQNRAYFDHILANGSLCSSIVAEKEKSMDDDVDASLGLHCSVQNLDLLTSACRDLINTVLDSFTLLYFETQEQDICSVYERLAMREAALAKGFSNSSPGITLAESDLARNLITSFGCNDTAQINLYKQYWAPIEQIAMRRVEDETSNTLVVVETTGSVAVTPSSTTAASIFPKNKCHFEKVPKAKNSSTSCGGAKHHTPVVGMTGHLNACLQAFMNRKEQRAPEGSVSKKDMNSSNKTHIHSQGQLPPLQSQDSRKSKSQSNSNNKKKMLDPGLQWTDPGEALFPMYSGLKLCIRQALESNNLPVAMHTPTPEAEAVVCHFLAELLQFATEEHDWA